MPSTDPSVDSPGVVYEVNLSIDVAQREPFLGWLNTHVQEMLTLAGFEQAFILDDENQPEPERYRCTVHYLLASTAHLQAYFDNYAERMRAQGVAEFGAALSANRRVLTTRAEYFAAPEKSASGQQALRDNQITCLDCQTVLRGQYCYACGQRDQRRLVTLTELIGDLVRDVISWDSRFWKTMGPLLTRPGHLTNAYLKGQRMRYSPPLRMYLVTSILFFLTATFQPQLALMNMDVSAPMPDDLQISFNGDSAAGANAPSPAILSDPSADSTAPLGNAPADDPGDAPGNASGNAQGNAQGNARTSDAPEDQPSDPAGKQDFESQCAQARSLEFPVFEELLRERVYHTCLRLTTREGLRTFALNLLDNLPGTLFILLPLMALANKILYLFSRRYYVEHLLYYVHTYSFVFLFTTILVIAGALFDAFSLNYFGWIVGLSIVYVVYYFIRSMRVVYGQSRLMTFIKWSLLSIVFLALAASILSIFAIVTAALVV